jgi:hypothetical protein
MLSAKDLLEDKTINEIVNKILENKEFVDECIDKIQNDVLKDNKIDTSDVPTIIYIVTLLLNNKPKIKIDNTTMKEVLKLLIVRLLLQVNYVKIEEAIPLLPDQEKIIDQSLELLGATLIVTKKCFPCLNI